MIKPTTKQIASNESTNAPQLQFSSYEQGKTYRNDGTLIDFVTDGKSLYVCAVETAVTSENTIEQEIELHGNFLKVISQGEQGAQGRPGDDGAPGATPNLTFRFDGKQLVISENGQRKAVSPDLAGPSWRPVLNGRSINWTLSKDTTAPQPLNIDDITVPERPLLLRTDSDNTRRLDEESGPARFIQWKYEGEEEWRNLISISELMNLALAGVAFWREEDGWHFGHKEVISATYSSDASGNQIISNVELGSVLFDAGAIPASLDGDALAAGLAALQDDVAALNDRLNNLPTAGDATKDWVRDQNYATQPWVRNELDNRGYATQSWVNGRGFLSEHQHIKTLNGQSLVGDGNVKVVSTINNQAPDANGNINITVPDGDGNVDLTGYATEEWVNAQDFIKNAGTLTGLVKSIKVNAQASAANPDANGLVTLNLAENPVCYLQISDGKLYRRNYTDTGWQEVGSVGGSGYIDENTIRQIVNSMIGDSVTNAVNAAIRDLEGRFVTVTVFNDAIGSINSRLAALEGGTVLVYRTFTAYKWSVNTPSTPGQVSWNPATSSLPVLTNGWNDHPINRDLDTPSDAKLWMTTITLPSDGTAASNWSTPINLTSNPGVDGNGVEFIYKLYTDLASFNADRVNVPSDAEPLDSVGHWYDHPQGISENDVIEAASMRTYDGTTGTWSHYCTPFIWSMWGEDGMDGDGVEYIFYVTGDNGVTRDASGKAVLNYSTYAGKIPQQGDNVDTWDNGHYQVDDWCPDGTTRGGYIMPDYNWTDNPSDVDINQPYEFVAIRKYNGETKKWGPFSEPKLWGYYGTTTIEIVTYRDQSTRKYLSWAFHRTNNNIADYRVVYDFRSFDPTHYTTSTTFNDLTDAQKALFYDNPLNYVRTLDGNGNQVNMVWTDGLPTDSDEQLWLIQAWIGDEGDPTDTGWTSPVKWGDQSGIQIEYAVSSTETDHVYNRDRGYTLPNLSLKVNGVPKYETDDPLLDHDGDGIDESLWRSDVETAGMGIWNDEKSADNPNGIVDPDYMAICIKRSNGQWSDWQISRIKGEQGEQGPQGEQGLKGADGLDGTGVEFVYYRTKGAKPSVNPNTGKYPSPSDGTSFNPEKDDWFPAVANIAVTQYDENGYWKDHPSGVDDTWTHEWYITRASHLDGNGKRYWDNYSAGNIAIWSQWAEDGKDGDGIEYIFTRSTENSLVYGVTLINPTTVDTTTTEYQAKNTEFIPTGWTDDPQGVDSVYKYEWVSIRKYRNEQWTAFSTPKVWAKWSTDGQRGPKGEDGTSFRPIGSINTLLSEYNTCSEATTNWKSNLHTYTQNAEVGETILITVFDTGNIIDHTDMWVYTGEDSSLDNCSTTGTVFGWRNAGPLQGPAGESSYVHQKFANLDEDHGTTVTAVGEENPVKLSFTPITAPFTKIGEFPGKYVGMRVDFTEEDSNVITDYKWSKWSGDDGFGMEQIFTLDQNATQHKPYLTSSGGTITTNVTKLTMGNTNTVYTRRQDIIDHYYDYDAVPTGIDGVDTWYDQPLTPTSSKQYCYVSVRKLNINSMIDWSTPAIYSNYARDGVDGKYEEYVYHTALVENPVPDLNQNSGYIKSGNTYNITSNNQQADFLPGDGTVNGHWTDNPSGVSRSVPYEFVSVRKYDGQTNTWGTFSTPKVWSHFGENGRDGDGIEYVFFPMTESEHLGIQLALKDGDIIPIQDLGLDPVIDSNGNTYLDDEFLPGLQFPQIDGGIYDEEAIDDNPGPTLEKPYVYYSTRKEIDGSWANVTFEPISIWKDKDYQVNIRNIADQPVTCDSNGTILEASKTINNVDIVYNRRVSSEPKYWDIEVDGSYSYCNNKNTITINNNVYTYAGAVNRIDAPSKLDGTALPYKWVRSNTEVYTSTMYPAANSYAYAISGSSYTIQSVNRTNLPIIIVGDSNASPNSNSRTIQINTSALLGNNDSVTVTVTGYFLDMYDKCAFDNFTVFKSRNGANGQKGDDGDDGSAIVFDTNYKTINLDNIPLDFKARVLNNGNIDNTWSFNVSFAIGNNTYTGNTYYSVTNGICSVDIEEFLDTRGTDSFDSLTVTASKSGFVNQTITIPTVHNGINGTPAVPYFFRGEWQPNTTYYHNNQRIDIVKRTVNNVVTYYIAKTEPEYYRTSTNNFNTDLNNEWWETFQGNYENIATGFIFAEGGYIEDLRVHSTQIDGKLKASEIETSDLGNGKITINQGGATWNGNNAILGYAANSTTPGIVISANPIGDLGVNNSTLSVASINNEVYTNNVLSNPSNTGNESDIEHIVPNYVNAGIYKLLVGSNFTITGNAKTLLLSGNLKVTLSVAETSGHREPFMPHSYCVALVLMKQNNNSWELANNWLLDTSDMLTIGSTGGSASNLGFGNVNNGSVYRELTSGTYGLAIVPTAPIETDDVFGTVDESRVQFIVDANASSFNLRISENCNEGVTIAPNGLRIYFNATNYLTFAKINNKIQCKFVAGSTSNPTTIIDYTES